MSLAKFSYNRQRNLIKQFGPANRSARNSSVIKGVCVFPNRVYAFTYQNASGKVNHKVEPARVHSVKNDSIVVKLLDGTFRTYQNGRIKEIFTLA